MAWLASLRSWWRGEPDVYMIIHGVNSLFLECEMAAPGYISSYRWTRNPGRATTFSAAEKAEIDEHSALPAGAQWYHVIGIPMEDNMARDKQEQEQSPTPQDKRAPEQPTGDYSHGHPGMPPKDYKPPKEDRR
jgi:hypothetical protein